MTVMDGGAISYQYDLDIPEIAELWRRSSVIASWLLDLTAATLVENPTLDGFAGRVSDSGEGRWTVLNAVEEGVPAPVLSAALYGRFDSRGRDEFANQMLSAMRQQFGGHREKAATHEFRPPCRCINPIRDHRRPGHEPTRGSDGVVVSVGSDPPHHARSRIREARQAEPRHDRVVPSG